MREVAAIELGAFVQETLVQIVEGVRGAQSATEGTGAVVSPKSVQVVQSGTAYVKTGLLPVARLVEFDVAVTASEEVGAKGKIGVFSLGLGAEAGGSTASSVVSRVKFGVFIQLPPA